MLKGKKMNVARQETEAAAFMDENLGAAAFFFVHRPMQSKYAIGVQHKF